MSVAKFISDIFDTLINDESVEKTKVPNVSDIDVTQHLLDDDPYSDNNELTEPLFSDEFEL